MKSKFKKNKSYKNLCMIFSSMGVIPENTTFTGEEWETVLGYGVGHEFDKMFTLVEQKKSAMRYPKKTKTGFTEEDRNSRQVNVHMGRKFDYWFVQPNHFPYVVKSGEIPSEMKGVTVKFRD